MALSLSVLCAPPLGHHPFFFSSGGSAGISAGRPIARLQKVLRRSVRSTWRWRFYDINVKANAASGIGGTSTYSDPAAYPVPAWLELFEFEWQRVLVF